MQQHIGFPMEISLFKFQAWQFDEKKNTFKFDFLNNQNICDDSLTFSDYRMSRPPFRVVELGWMSSAWIC